MNQHTAEEVSEQVSLYVLGALEKGESDLFENHLAECEACGEELRSFDQVIASLGEPLEVSAPRAVRDRLTGFLQSEPPAPTKSASAIKKVRSGEGEWTEIGPGVFQKVLFEDHARGTTTSLLKLAPGSGIPSHQHDGVEECILLEGDVYSDTETFASGDYMYAPAGSLHEQLRTMHGALMFIVAGHAAHA